GRAVAPCRRFFHRLGHPRGPYGLSRPVRPDLWIFHLWAGLAVVLAVVPRLGRLGSALLWPDPWQPLLCHHRHACDGSRNAHLVRSALLLCARRRACRCVLSFGLGFDPAGAAGLFLQRTAAPAA